MSSHYETRRKTWKKKVLKDLVFSFVAICIVFFAFFVSWVANMELPDFDNFENRSIANSTKIYDRDGKTVLYNIHDGIRRTKVSIDEISPYIKQATVSIEDSHFYEHNGFRPTSFARAVIANFLIFFGLSDGFTQGGSTINQQVIKNALLTREKTITRKIKEIILSIKLDREVPKDKILQIYLNESPYGGTLYGVEEASLTYFNKHAKDVTLTEAAYLASLPQSPTRYSPYGKNLNLLENRKNLVLQKMFENGYITKEQMELSQNEKITFERDVSNSGKALHFVMYVREYLEEKYGVDTVLNGGLKVTTTLNYDLQTKLEEIAKEGALSNEKKFNAKNISAVAIDPKTGQILSMVGSRDFFDKEIPGQYNIATALRQPGSSIKPIIYAGAFNLGYTPETVLFDVPTQFSSLCDAYGNPKKGVSSTSCYMPDNYDGLFRGPMSLRDALAQSINVPAVKVLYLLGIKNAVSLAQKMGLSTIDDPSRYGLSLVLGGGEVTLLEMTNAYGVFANNGIYNKPRAILEVKDSDGNILEKWTPEESNVLPESVTSSISSILSDNVAKAPAYGSISSSPFYFGDRPVASKTGTTNDYRDVWVIGYTPSIVLGMWGGNNDNTPIDKKVAGLVLAPIWHKAMNEALSSSPVEYFPEPIPNSSSKEILKGNYCSSDGIHTILRYVIKDNPDSGYPINSEYDPQYNLWETSIQNWLAKHPLSCGD